MPMSFLAEVQKIGMTVPAARALGRAAASSSALTVAFGQVFLHQGVVALDDGVDQLRAGGGQVDGAAGRRLPAESSTLTTPLNFGPGLIGALNSTQPLPKVSWMVFSNVHELDVVAVASC